MVTRRNILKSSVLLGCTPFITGLSLSASAQTKSDNPGLKSEEQPTESTGPHKVPPLPYSYNALEPHIDEQTMRLHHDRHHQTYVNNLNGALAQNSDLSSANVDEILTGLDKIPESIRTVVRNNAGGHANHTMFWSIMAKPSGNDSPTGDLESAITNTFGSFNAFKEKFNEAAEKHFGAGWVFLAIKPKDGQLNIVTKQNQDTPLMDGQRVVLGNDLWEHAFYLKYNDKRTNYIKSWWNVVNWSEASNRYDAIRAGERIV